MIEDDDDPPLPEPDTSGEWKKTEDVPAAYLQPIGFNEMISTLSIEAELKRATQARLKTPQVSEMRKADVLDRAADVINKLLGERIKETGKKR